MTNQISDAIALLKEKGVIPGLGATERDLDEIVRMTGNRIGKDFLHVYSHMNGFSYDSRSYLRLWSLKQILEEQSFDEPEYIIIGDFLIESDYITVEIREDPANVHLLHDGRLMASSVHEFIVAIASGRFDFVKHLQII